MKKTIKLTTILGIPVEINYSWFIIFGLVVYTLAVGYFPMVVPEYARAAHWLMAIFAAFLLFASLLAHELSHSYVAKKNNLPISGITLFVFGGVAHMEKEPPTPQVEFKMAIAGPLMSFFLFLVFLGLTQFSYFLRFPRGIIIIFDYLSFLNLAVGIFNLIPGFPLDGGRVLRSALWYWQQDIRKATRIASGFGKGFAFLLMALGFIWLIQGIFIAGIWFIFLGLFLQEAADISYRQVVMKKILTGIRVKDIMTKNVIAVPKDATIQQLIDKYFFKYRHTTFPVQEDDTLLGIVTFHEIKEVPKELWSTKTANDILFPIRPNYLIDKNADLTEALTQMAQNKLGRLLIIEKYKMIGILSQKDVMRIFEIRQEMEG